MRRTGFGLTLDVPTGWSSAIVRRPADAPDVGAPSTPLAEGRGAPGDPREKTAPSAPTGPRERTLPIVHVSTRPLPAPVGDFGSGLVEVMAPDDVFVALLEYGSDLAGTGLFERQGVPRLAPSHFAPNRMPRDVVGRSASQHFFSIGGRAFCLFTVLGSHSRRMGTVPRAAAVVRSLRVESAATMHARGVVV